MEKLLHFSSRDLPENYKYQILSFLRIRFPEGFTGDNRLRNLISPDWEHPEHFIIEEDGILISHTEVKWKYLRHMGEIYKVYGLSGVLTYPALRERVMESA